MLEALGPGTRLGYCTNVHAGHDLQSTLANLEQHAARVRERLEADQLGVGLWLAADAAEQAAGCADELRARLDTLGLRVFTLNGFPYSNFHEPVVKHRVYEPNWGDPRRLEYTKRLALILHRLLPEGEEGSISTLPIGWPAPPCAPVDTQAAAAALRELALHLKRLEETTGRLIHVDLEPETGCILERSPDVVSFWRANLQGGPSSTSDAVNRYIRVCHDVCHAAVMFERQEEAFDAYRRAGVRVGKVQISSALRAGNNASDDLCAFVEPRYLHQTSIRDEKGVRTFEDLPQALASTSRNENAEWRVHFHVPIFLESIGTLRTTSADIPMAVDLARRDSVRHFEVETYAWGVLPPAHRTSDLSEGIAAELRWAAARCNGARP